MYALPQRYENIRELPYPYKTLVAISSDVEYSSVDFLDYFLPFLNTKDATPLGRGLGLAFASSVFFYSNTHNHASLFDGLGLDAPLSRESSRLFEYIKCGLIDTNHAFGDFNDSVLFTREHALKAYELIDKHNLKLPIFTIHGNGNLKAMRQNVGFLPYHLGSVVGSEAYHTDLFRKYGGKYIWTDDWVDEPLLSIGLNGQAFCSFDGRKPGVGPIMQKLYCGDSTYYFFRRYRGTGVIAPTFQTFNHQVQSLDWEYLYNNSSVVIFYQHFGRFYVAHNSQSVTLELLLKYPYYLQGFYFLKEQQDKGNLLVLTTSALLSYLEMYYTTKVEHSVQNGVHVYRICNYEDRSLDFFNNLTIYISNPREPIAVYYKDHDVRFIYNGLDRRGLYSITITEE